MSWSMPRTGSVVRELRERASLSPEELAGRMLTEGFSSSRVHHPHNLAEHIRTIEAGGPWPLEHKKDVLPFRRACIRAVQGQRDDDRQRDDDARLRDAMTADVLAHEGLL